MRTIQHILITGASGYIGAHLVRRSLAEGRLVTILGRREQTAPAGVRFAKWELGDDLPNLGLPRETTALLHLAHDRSDHGPDGINFRGTRLLLTGARAQGLKRFVFVSSQSARVDALNGFGRLKWRIEQLLDGPDTVSARVGLVYGGARKGMFGELAGLVCATPVLPMIEPRRPVQPIHIDEVCRGLLALADGEMTGWVGLGGPDPVSFGEFLRALAQEGFASSLAIIPIPLRAALWATAVSARIPFGPKVDRERILGLAGTKPLDCRAHLDSIGLSVVPLRQGLRRDEIGRKALLIEARVLCGYILGRKVGGSLQRRYARAVGTLEPGSGPLALPWIALRFPGLLRLFEPLGQSSALSRRLRVALALSEMSIDGFAAIDRVSRRSRAGTAWSVLALIAVEIIVFPVRLLSRKR